MVEANPDPDPSQNWVVPTKRATWTHGRIPDTGPQAAAGSGFELLPSDEMPEGCMTTAKKERCAISETGTGFAGAKLSEVLPRLAMHGSSGW